MRWNNSGWERNFISPLLYSFFRKCRENSQFSFSQYLEKPINFAWFFPHVDQKLCMFTSALPKNITKIGMDRFALYGIIVCRRMSESSVNVRWFKDTEKVSRACVTRQFHVSRGITRRPAPMSRWLTRFNLFFFICCEAKLRIVWEKTGCCRGNSQLTIIFKN